MLAHPYDDDRIIAGQGTVALEMLEDEPGLECLVVPIGGGGLMSGVALAAKHLKPEIEMIGAEVKLYPSMYHALRGQTGQCGGNIDPRILASVILRELEREQRIVNLRILIDDRPGVLGRIATAPTSSRSRTSACSSTFPPGAPSSRS